MILLTIILIHLLAVISPGPDFIMAVKNSLQYSRKTGIYTAVGFGLGITCHLIYCLAGIALIISQSILLFNTIKLLGAAYLIYIGIKAITGKSSKLNFSQEEKRADISPLKAIRMGFLTNVLNPKATIFFLGLFTIVISPNTPWQTLMLASIIMIINTTLWFSLVAIFFTHPRIRRIFDRFQNAFNKVFGGLLILLGLRIAITER
jgi:RhtB (resistance to homoserine/threonine) family protein